MTRTASAIYILFVQSVMGSKSNHISRYLQEILVLVEAIATEGASAATLDKLTLCVAKSVSIIKSITLTAEETKDVLSAAAEIWNSSIGMGDIKLDSIDRATIRQCSSEICMSVPNDQLQPEEKLEVIRIFYQTGCIWKECDQHEAAEAALCKGMESAAWLQDKCFKTQQWRACEEECGSLLFNLMKTRIQNSEHLKQQMLFSALISQLYEYISDARIPVKESTGYRLEFVQLLKSQGTNLLQGGVHPASVERAIPLLNLAYEVLGSLDTLKDDLPLMEEELRDLACC